MTVLRRKWDDDWGYGDPDDEGEELKRGRESPAGGDVGDPPGLP
jgi:hypothetical protein